MPSQSLKQIRELGPMRVLRGLVKGDLASEIFASLMERATALPKPSKPGPLIVSGFLSEHIGIGRASQMTIKGLKTADLNPKTHNISDFLHSGSFAQTPFFSDTKGGVWILHCNPIEALTLASKIRPSDWQDRYRIGFWAYELQEAPPEWIDMAKFFHEIWVPSKFVANTFSNLSVPVRIVPHFHDLGEISEPTTPQRRSLGIDSNCFLVGAAADLKSSLCRKNLIEGIEIYSRAFSENDDTALVLKISNSDWDKVSYNRLIEKCAGRRDIHLLNKSLNDSEVFELARTIDVFLSPHRAEGYGLFLSECILAGTPVLATEWSGNLDFMHDLDDLLIKQSLVPVADRTGIYENKNNALWAQPDIGDGVRKLQKIYKSADDANRMTEIARSRIIDANKIWEKDGLQTTNWAKLVSG